MSICLVMLLTAVKGIAQNGSILFQIEKIKIEVAKNQCTLTGDYTFQNPASAPVQKTLYYPVVVDSSLPYPHSFQIEDPYSDAIIPHTKSAEGIRFSISIPPYSVRTWRVTYQQKCPEQIFEYILLSTHTWKRPLNRSEILIYVPNDKTILDISLPVKRLEDTEGYHVYYFKQSDFWPDRNLIIHWGES